MSLLNVDYEIGSKALATRLENVFPKIIPSETEADSLDNVFEL